ncbi:hypothetical protein AMIS_55840 [Actinoplanes missouriensis 431]|uniref:Activator of Hsp90 ATPase homologue 1/2-like C-terminal domain-containing protein n=1 Tax=Actinoplanes missouriensis (strain ATCC 14538 / DSM 43046 / CBS 188.64 / JCM 3121 / NBRC 102363 / NCIMB 12654 / NRRL B-3342 / UNCC 431) TaxID=512565 RepID=I0HCR7_ACTM4|nr:SRPBCC domain-containing protein [Actinoplanes missouriensis]BAL90804.1 hypothetical protein AMIS_55840 [Actinoplanes missouriensis 431]
MPVISATKDVDTLTMTFVAEFEATVERVWQIWADPRKLERWWGPPAWPATFERFEFEPGGQARYYMTGPDGTKAHGWWTITAIEAPHRLEFDDGFADENAEPIDPKDAMHDTVTIEAAGDRTRMTTVTSFSSVEQLERMVEIGVEEGMREAQNQIDELLAA